LYFFMSLLARARLQTLKIVDLVNLFEIVNDESQAVQSFS